MACSKASSVCAALAAVTMVVLDTDHISVLERRDRPGAVSLRARSAPLPPGEPVLAFDDAAAVIFHQLRRARLRIGTMDVKIAAIVPSRMAGSLNRSMSLPAGATGVASVSGHRESMDRPPAAGYRVPCLDTLTGTN